MKNFFLTAYMQTGDQLEESFHGLRAAKKRANHLCRMRWVNLVEVITKSGMVVYKAIGKHRGR